jgi:hypothetical protein
MQPDSPSGPTPHTALAPSYAATLGPTKIERSDAKLQDERDRRIRERKELLHEKVVIQDRHESEMRRLTQEAHDA